VSDMETPVSSLQQVTTIILLMVISDTLCEFLNRYLSQVMNSLLLTVLYENDSLEDVPRGVHMTHYLPE
jgi:hypothetical protein